MENLCDDVLYKILVRLPGKSLLRFRCVSKHWNRLISDPYFMKSRSRRMTLLPFPRPLVVLDDDEAYSMVGIRSPLDHQEKPVGVSIVGTFNGIVLLALTDRKSLLCQLILYNPLTCASKKLLVMDIPPSCKYQIPYVFGFGDDFKIVRFEIFSHQRNGSIYRCNVFDLKTSSWSTRHRFLRRDFHFLGDAGMFLNGFLYWATSSIRDGIFGILALNVKDMVFSRKKLPVQLRHAGPLLGSIDGSLCMVCTNDDTKFDLWVRKKEDEISWLKSHSFTIHLEAYRFNQFRPVCILGNGKILFTTRTMLLVMYDTSKDSYEMLYRLLSFDDFKPNYSVYCFQDIRSIEYVETLVSPSDICSN